MDFRIVNIIASTDIGENLDLSRISNDLINANYDPDIYLALKYFLKQPKITILVHKKGKIIFSGAKTINNIFKARKIFFSDLKKIGYHPRNNEIFIDNVVIVSQLKHRVNLGKDFRLNENFTIQYEPEIFPGSVIKSSDPKFTLILFDSGKFSIVGLKDIKIIPRVIGIVEKLF